jgi:hypothetical protein
MDELHHHLDKFARTADHLTQIAERIEPDDPNVQHQISLALAEAKRVRRESNLLVRALARLRDQLQP